MEEYSETRDSNSDDALETGGELSLEELLSKAKELKKFLKTLQSLDNNSTQLQQFQCPDCTYESSNGRSFVEHLKIHSSFHLYHCEDCHFSTKSEDDFSDHRSTHGREKKYACDQCDYRTCVKGSLVQHIPIHKGERPFACTLCDYKANRKWNLTQHILTHKQEKNFNCRLCTYKTSIKSRLRNHYQDHNAKKLQCSKCSYKTLRAGALRQHMFTHSIEKRFQCSICDYRTNRKWSLRHHFSNAHSKKWRCPPPSSCEFSTVAKRKLREHRKTRRRPCSDVEDDPSVSSEENSFKAVERRVATVAIKSGDESEEDLVIHVGDY